MDGYQFEYQCAEILKRNGFSRVQVTQSSGDQGVDIIARKHRKKYGIQCKYYSYPVGNKAVQEAYAGANFYDCDKAMVMTNLTFTRAATELAEKLEVELWDHCPTTRYYSLLFKLDEPDEYCIFSYMEFCLLFFIQNKDTFSFSSARWSSSWCPSGSCFSLRIFLDGDLFSAIWQQVVSICTCHLHTVLLPAINNAAYSDLQLLVLLPTVVYLLPSACWLARSQTPLNLIISRGHCLAHLTATNKVSRKRGLCLVVCVNQNMQYSKNSCYLKILFLSE